MDSININFTPQLSSRLKRPMNTFDLIISHWSFFALAVTLSKISLLLFPLNAKFQVRSFNSSLQGMKINVLDSIPLLTCVIATTIM